VKQKRVSSCDTSRILAAPKFRGDTIQPKDEKSFSSLATRRRTPRNVPSSSRRGDLEVSGRDSIPRAIRPRSRTSIRWATQDLCLRSRRPGHPFAPWTFFANRRCRVLPARIDSQRYAWACPFYLLHGRRPKVGIRFQLHVHVMKFNAGPRPRVIYDDRTRSEHTSARVPVPRMQYAYIQIHVIRTPSAWYHCNPPNAVGEHFRGDLFITFSRGGETATILCTFV
jgi:hypothetical protein